MSARKKNVFLSIRLRVPGLNLNLPVFFSHRIGIIFYSEYNRVDPGARASRAPGFKDLMPRGTGSPQRVGYSEHIDFFFGLNAQLFIAQCKT
jgi:hypothetical protein